MTESSLPTPSDENTTGGCSCGCTKSAGSASMSSQDIADIADGRAADNTDEKRLAANPAASIPKGRESLDIRERKPEEHRLQGHSLLAKMGKRVLRPGGIELTQRLIEHAHPTTDDRIIEFGPGLGRTAEILLAVQPERYYGIDPSSPDVGKLRKVLAKYPNAELVQSDATDSGLADESATLVVGEAMLTMQPPQVKQAIIAEAFRLLAPGGRYAIHELGFQDSAPQGDQKDVSKVLSRTIKVGARPLTLGAWGELLEDAGFVVTYTSTNPMHLLEPKRLIADEGFVGAARFATNVLRNKTARKRIKAMRSVFRMNEDCLTAVALIAHKPATEER